MLLLRSIALTALTTALLACGADSESAGEMTERSFVNPSVAGGDGAPFSGAVMSGNTLYISGMLGLENGRQPEDPAQEARNMLDSIQATLVQAGMSMDDLVHVTVYTTDLGLYDVFNEVYRGYFSETFPARAFIGAGSLLRGARFEMQSIAVRD